MAGWATKLGGETMDVSIPVPPGTRYTAYTRRQPVGVVLASCRGISPDDCHLEDGAGPGCRLHRGAQAFHRNSAHRAASG
jgi:hypothetical protein